MLAFLSIAPFVLAVIMTFVVRAVIPSAGLLIAWIIGISIVSFFTYGYDKAVSGSGATRVPEVVLHLLTLLGGTLGSFLGMRLFRHKTQKRGFQAVFWVIVAAQVIGLIWLAANGNLSKLLAL